MDEIQARAGTRPHRTAEAIHTVTSATFGALVLEGTGPIAVEFMSYGCAHCRMLEPVLQQAAAMLKPKENTFRVNVAIEPELAANYNIEVTPTFVMFLDGSTVGRSEGPQPELSNILAVLTRPFE